MATLNGQIKLREITQEMQESYLNYAMSVIVARALPDIRDGLKPVHRRILYSMQEMGLRPGAKYQKSAKIVGHCMGNFHPHGDVAIYDSLVRMAQDFSLRYPLVDGQGNFGCFTKDTKVKTTDGRDPSFEELVVEHQQGKRNYTYTVNALGLIAIAEIKNPCVTRKQAKLVEVALGNGERVRCTPDHRFMLRGGNYCEAKDLHTGQSLMPIYQKLSEKTDRLSREGYVLIHQNKKDEWVPVHHLADNYNLTAGVYPKNAGRVRHHVDFNKLNNNPSNIKRLSWGKHWQIHYQHAKLQHQNPEYRAKIAAGRSAYWSKAENREKNARLLAERSQQWWQDPNYKQARIKAVKKLWSNPEYKEMMRAASSGNLKALWKTPGFYNLLSKQKSAELKERWKDPIFRKHITELTKTRSLELWSNPKHRQYISELNKAKWVDPAKRKIQSKFSKELWASPEFRAKFSTDHFKKMAKTLWSDPAVVEQQRARAKAQWQNSDFREKVIIAVRAGNRRYLTDHPDHMCAMAQKSARILRFKWKEPNYRIRVVQSKISGFVNKLLVEGKRLNKENYNQARTNNGVPEFSHALKYFSGLAEMKKQAKLYNHRVVSVRFLSEREDVYDLTVDGTHNFALAAGVFVHNSIDGDPAAAMRYSEAKMAPIAEAMLADIDKETVDLVNNFDATGKEPSVLPAKIPNLLLNGSMGIAVGMATNIPPHNLSEVIDGLVHLIDHPDADVTELTEFVKGPDFPTGGTIYNERDLQTAYATGKGPVVMRAKAEIIESERKGFQIIINEIPYQVNKAELIMKIAELVKDKKVEGIKDVRDESDKDGLRIAVDLKPDAFPRKVLNQLYKYTELQKTFHFNMLGLVDGIQPQILGLKTLLEKFIEHRQTVVTRRTRYDRRKAEERAHILEGLKQALDHIDEVIKLIKQSDSKEDAFNNLIKRFKFSDRQATAILEMRLQALAGLERKKIEDELKEKQALVAHLKDLLAHPKKILGVIKEEFREIKEKYGDQRRTKIVKGALKEIGEEELIPEAESLFLLTQGGYLKRIPPDALRVQKRGGRGLLGIATKEEDVVQHFFVANTHDQLMFFTNSGKVFSAKGYEVPESTRQAKGKAIVNFLQVTPTDRITAVVPLAKNDGAKYLVMITANGVIKKVEKDAFGQVRKNGLIAIRLKGADELKWVLTSSGSDEIIMTTSAGTAIRFKEKDIRAMGRAAAGVIGMRLDKNVKIVGADVVKAGKTSQQLQLLAVLANGYGKRTALAEYKVQKRGGKGIMTAKLTAKTGALVSAHITGPEDKEIIAVSKKGVVIRTQLDSVSELGRATQGVRVMKLDQGDAVASAVVV